ncbi:MAG: glycosyltransferase [Candidatus Binatia bacterium]
MSGDHADPLVSIIMPSYQYARFLREALDSVRAQTYSHWELVAVDDGSTDGSREILQAFAATEANRVRLILHERPAGCSAGYNEALSVARGDYVAFLSGDDTLVPERLEVQVAAFEKNPSASLCHGDLDVIDASGRTTARLKNSSLPRHLVPWFVYTRGTPFWTPTVMLKGRDWRFSTDLEIYSDVELWVRAAAAGEVLCVSVPLARWRRHGANLSLSGARARRDRARLLSWMRRSYPLEELFPRPIVAWGWWSFRHCVLRALAASAMAAARQRAWRVAFDDVLRTARAAIIGYGLRRGRSLVPAPWLVRVCGPTERGRCRDGDDPERFTATELSLPKRLPIHAGAGDVAELQRRPR